jgi:hypothetical protein
MPAQIDTRVGASDTDPDAVCIDAVRGTNSPIAILQVGNPVRRLYMLLRLDHPTNIGQEADGACVDQVIITNPKVLHSISARCKHNVTSNIWSCTDTMIVYNAGAYRDRQLVSFRYRFGHHAMHSNEATLMGLDGEIHLCRGHAHSLLSREFCVAPLRSGEEEHLAHDAYMCSSTGGLHAFTVAGTNGQLQTTVGAMLAADDPFAGAPPALFGCVESTSVDVFPVVASLPEVLTLATANEIIAIVGVAGYTNARYAVEVGSACASGHEELRHAHSSFKAQCESNAVVTGTSCARTAHIAYYRAARHRLRILVEKSGAACIYASIDPALSLVPMHDDDHDTIAMAWLRIILILIAAAIVWLRSTDVEVSVDRTLRSCILRAVLSCEYEEQLRRQYETDATNDVVESEPCDDLHSPFSDAQQLVLGVIASVSRLVVARMRARDMQADALGLVVASETILGCASIVHCIMLSIGAAVRKYMRGPDTEWIIVIVAALGGSSAIVDIACATMLAFTDTPVRGGTNSFDAVARLLTAVLLTLVCLCRCTFSSACCGTIGQTEGSVVRVAAVAGTLYWIAQTASVAIVLCTLFAIPTAMGWVRSSAGDPALMTVLVFVGITLLSGPRTVHTALGVVRAVSSARVKRRKSRKKERIDPVAAALAHI